MRCTGEWQERIPDPRYCPLCKSPSWNKPRERDYGAHAHDARGAVKRGGDDATVSAVRPAKSPAKRLRKVQPLRDELAGRGKSGEGPTVGAVGKATCPVDAKHRFLPYGDRWWCSDCRREY